MDHADLHQYDRWSPTLLGMSALLQLRILRPTRRGPLFRDRQHTAPWKAWPTGSCGCSVGRSCRSTRSKADLRLAADVITAWRERLALSTDGRERREVHSVLFAIRGLYRDLGSHDDPVRWGCGWRRAPVPRAPSRAAAKNKRRQKNQMRSRTRVLTPLLPGFWSP